MAFAWRPTTPEVTLDRRLTRRRDRVAHLVVAGYRLRAVASGHAAEMALTVRGIGSAEALVMTHGAEVPHPAGMFSGPRHHRHPAVQREADRTQAGHDPDAPGDEPGVSWQGGGSGDPLRDPGAVRDEAANGLVSASAMPGSTRNATAT